MAKKDAVTKLFESFNKPYTVSYDDKVVGFAETAEMGKKLAQKHATKRKYGKIYWRRGR